MVKTVHSAVSYTFVTAAIARLSVGCITRRPPTRHTKVALAALILATPITALQATLRAPPRWRAVFITSLCTATFTSVALATLDYNTHGLHPLGYAAWALSAAQFAHRCWYYSTELHDALQHSSEREAFFSMCSFNMFGGKPKLPCTVLNQAFMLLISAEFRTPAGADLLLALALSDFLCVFQLFLCRQRRFPASFFLEGATLLSSAPATCVFAAHGRTREALILCGGLVAWLGAARLLPVSATQHSA